MSGAHETDEPVVGDGGVLREKAVNLRHTQKPDASERDECVCFRNACTGAHPALVAAQGLHDEQVVQLIPRLRKVHL